MTHRTVISDYDSCVGINLGFLTDEELGMIHSGALEVLWNCGVSVEAKEAQELLAEAGANVDFETGIVKFPEWLVEESLRSVPSQFTLYGRDDSHDIVIGGNRVHMSTFGQATKAVDLETGETRPSTLQDLSDQALLTDALPEIDITERSLTANDAPYAPLAPLYEAAKVMPNTVKPMVYGPGNGYCAQKIIDMAAAAAGGHEALRQKPSLIINICPTSPLKIAPGACNAIIAAARAGIPNNILTMALAGVTAPVTLAGTLVVHVAEFLAALTLNQAACKGSAVIIGTSDTEFDMMTMQTPVGSPEMAVLAAACARIGRYYNVPSWVGGG